MDKYKNRKVIVIAAVILVTIFFSGFYLGRNNNKINSLFKKQIAYSEKAKEFSVSSPKDSFNFNLYWEVWDSLKQNYVARNKLTNKELFYGSLKGLTEAAKDPYTVFMDPKETKEFYNDLAGTFEGIGAEVGVRKDIITIIAPLDGMPAQKAGLRSGDKVYAIDGQSTLGLSLQQAVKKIRGPKNTKVVLTIIRGNEKPQDITIVRNTIFVKSVKTKLRKDGIYVIKISSFNNDTVDLFNKAVKEILLKNPKGIILDLRNDPGGYLSAAVDIASEWIKAGPVVAEQFNGNKRDEKASTGRNRLASFPTVVLINGGSASASEILAGALRDYKKAILVGETSYGKGSVQSLRSLSDGSSLKITVAHWLTPAGDFINDKGIKPDIEVKVTKKDIENNVDPQLNKAIEILKKGNK